MTNREKFSAALDVELRKQLKIAPRQYMYTEQDVPNKVASIVRGLTTRTGLVGPATRVAAKSCGIKANPAAIRDYLKG